MRQKTILLCLVEPMDFVNEQQSSAPIRVTQARCFENLLQIGNTCEDGTDLFEGQIGRVREKLRNGGLADTRWSPKDERRHPAENT